jgi:hypothetical protein
MRKNNMNIGTKSFKSEIIFFLIFFFEILYYNSFLILHMQVVHRINIYIYTYIYIHIYIYI